MFASNMQISRQGKLVMHHCRHLHWALSMFNQPPNLVDDQPWCNTDCHTVDPIQAAGMYKS